MKLLLIIPALALALTTLLACWPAAPSLTGDSAGNQIPPQVAPPGVQEDAGNTLPGVPQVGPQVLPPDQEDAGNASQGAPQDGPQVLPPDVQEDPGNTSQGVPQVAPQVLPPDHVGTLPPTNTPRPTLIPDLPAVATEAAMLRAEKAVGQSEPALDEQVATFTRESRDNRYEAIVRAVVESHRTVEPVVDIEWPETPATMPYFVDPSGEDAYFSDLRTKLDIKKTYYGNLPQGYELLAPEFALNQGLEKGKEYIIYIARVHASAMEFPDREDLFRLNEEQLNALGGAGGIALLGRTWIIDGDTAWRITRDYVLSDDPRTGLEAAKANGDSLSVTALESAINTGLGN